MLSIVRVNRNRELSPILEDYFDTFINGTALDRNKTTFSDKGDSVAIQIEAPGFSKENISISLKEDIMTISGKIEETEEACALKTLRSFSKTFSTEGIDIEGITAKCKDGILTVTCPKVKAEKEPEKKIPIE